MGFVTQTHIFTSYVKEHFLKYVQSRDSSQPVLLLYDGHRSHISQDSKIFRKLYKLVNIYRIVLQNVQHFDA
jgi:hypothetical protein